MAKITTEDKNHNCKDCGRKFVADSRFQGLRGEEQWSKGKLHREVAAKLNRTVIDVTFLSPLLRFYE